MIKRILVAIVALALVGGGIVGFNIFRDQAIEGFFANRQTPALPVDTVVAEAAPWTPALETIGTVFANRGIDVAVEGTGVVREVNFDANDVVERGQVLVRIADEVEQADLASARTQVRLSQQTLERVNSLGDRGIASGSSIDEAEAAFETAQAQVRRIEALIEQKVLVAPFTGTIGIPAVEEGQFVTPGTVVASLQDLERLRADFSLPEQNLPLIELGQPVELTAETGARATGFVTGVEPRVDAATRLVAMRAGIDNGDGKLSPGQFVQVRVALPAKEGVVAVPQTAVVTSLYGDYVYAVVDAEAEGDGEGDAPPQRIARQVFVETGSRQADRVEIVQGVSPGDRIVVAGQNRLSNGAPVSPEGQDGGAEAAPDAGPDTSPAAETGAPPEANDATDVSAPAGSAQAAGAGE